MRERAGLQTCRYRGGDEKNKAEVNYSESEGGGRVSKYDTYLLPPMDVMSKIFSCVINVRCFDILYAHEFFSIFWDAQDWLQQCPLHYQESLECVKES